MKKLRLFLMALVALCTHVSLSAQDLPAIPSGIFALGNEVTAVETGKWYFLYNHATLRYANENTSLQLKQATSPNGLDVAGNLGYLVTLEEDGNGKYYLRTGRGNYYKGPSSTARGTGAPSSKAASWAMAITPIADNPGHFLLQGSSTYNLAAPTDGSDLIGKTAKSANSISDWGFIEVKTASVEELKGRDLYNYQMGKLGLMRFKNKRSPNYLTTTASGSAVGAAKTSADLSQVWIVEKSGSGYTLRSANTGQYLQEDFAKPAGGAKELYIQFSPNNTGDAAYINISSKSDFSGSTCLNLGNNGTTITKWSYANDAGSDWAIELVEDVTENDVREHLNAANGYVSELKSGSYYRIVSTQYGTYATEVDNDVKGLNLDAANYGQYWQLTKSSTGYSFQNVLTQNYIQVGTGTSRIYRTAASKATLYPARTSDKWMYYWTIANTSGGSVGMHTDASKNVVQWGTDADASKWAFIEVTLTDEEIDAARGGQQEFEDLVAKLPELQQHLTQLFSDWACTALRPNIQALSDDALAANEDFAALTDAMKAMVLKVKNNTWQTFTLKNSDYTADYEKFFRIADYKIYSNYTEMSNAQNFTMAYSFGRLSGPTGIVANPNDIIYIYVDEPAKEECSLAVEVVGTDGVAGNHATGSQISLKQGVNVIRPAQQSLLYIFHQLNNTKKYLADYPDIRIHIEGGQLNGYWDATRGMTNKDWKLLQQDLLKAPFVNLKTERLIFQMDRDLLLAAEPNEMEGLMRIWDKIVENEESYMGIEDFEGRYRNIWNAFSGASSYMHASTYGTWYTESTISTVMNYEKMRQPGNIWGPSHEIGHNHQGSINICGTTESSNNLFSNINVFEQGIQTTRCFLPSDNFNALAEGKTWVLRDIWNTTRMFFQLYLYFHGMHHDDQFLPNLFRALRKNPIEKRSGWDSTTPFEDGGETKTGANITYGRLDYLHLAKTVCDVAQADLSEFFESYGMFVPADKVHVGDYANYLVTTTQADINNAKKYMQKYPKKLGNIMFMDDHILPMKAADPNNKFEGKPDASGKRVNNLGQHDGNLPVGDVGDYELFDGRTQYEAESDYFTLSSAVIEFKGSGFVGHKFYDLDGNLIWATNAKKTTLPTKLRTLGVENFRVVAAQANMTDVPCPYFNRSTSPLTSATVYFGSDEGSKKWYANATTKVSDYLPANAVAVVDGASEFPTLLEGANVIAKDKTAQSLVIDGNQPFYLPEDITATNLTFTKDIEGYAALNLPFAVTSTDISGLQVATYANDVLNVQAADNVPAGQAAVVQGPVNLTLQNAAVVSGNYQALSAVNILAADGASVVAVETASPFTFPLSEATAIRTLDTDKNSKGATPRIYDLSGRSLQRVAQPGIYIINGKKVIVK